MKTTFSNSHKVKLNAKGDRLLITDKTGFFVLGKTPKPKKRTTKKPNR